MLYAAKLARALGAPLHVLRAWETPNAPRPADSAFGYMPSWPELEAYTREVLDTHMGELGLAGEATTHVAHGGATKELVHSSAGADLLVVGRRGAGGFRGLLLGSTADQVIQAARCPVVVVPDHDDA